MLLERSTWRDVENYLGRSTGVLVPIGSMEQHGPNGLIGTDAICAERIARRVGEQADILVGPTIGLGVAQFNLGFPGTVSLRAEVLMGVLTDYVRSLASQGFERFFFLNGHGGNVAPANAAFQDLYAAQSYAISNAGENRHTIRCRLRNWREYARVDALRKEMYGVWEGMHATPSEVAITQHAYPNSIRDVPMAKPQLLDDNYYRDFGGDRHYDSAHHRRWFPDGRIGSDPSLATPKDGARLVEATVREVIADYDAFLAED